MTAYFNYRRMRRIFRPQNERRCKFVCVVLIFIVHVLVYIYFVFGSPEIRNFTFSRIVSGRLFSYKHSCDLDFSQKDWTINPNTTWELLEKEFAIKLKLGGRYTPGENAKDDIVVIVPYRDREQQLKTFIRYMHKYLQCKRLAYQIVVVEMTPGVEFNRALLLNIGFIETLKRRDQDCFIFHDVDLLPENISTPYNCERSPLHMAVAIDTKNYTLPYLSYFGGIYALKREHFQRVNGHSNQYFGWGGEDDDFHDRLKHSNLTIRRLPEKEGRYHMLQHAKEKPNSQKYFFYFQYNSM